MLLQAGQESIMQKTYLDGVRPEVRSPFNLSAILLAQRQAGETRLSHYIRQLLIEYITKFVDLKEQNEKFVILSDMAYQENLLPVSLLAALLENPHFTLPTEFDCSNRWPLDFPIVLGEYPSFFF